MAVSLCCCPMMANLHYLFSFLSIYCTFRKSFRPGLSKPFTPVNTGIRPSFLSVPFLPLQHFFPSLLFPAVLTQCSHDSRWRPSMAYSTDPQGQDLREPHSSCPTDSELGQDQLTLITQHNHSHGGSSARISLSYFSALTHLNALMPSAGVQAHAHSFEERGLAFQSLSVSTRRGLTCYPPHLSEKCHIVLLCFLYSGLWYLDPNAF